MELNEHVPVHVLKPEHPEYRAPLDDDIQFENDDEDPEEDPSEEHEPKDDDEDPEDDPNEEHEPKDEDTKDPSEDSKEIEPFEEDKTVVTPSPPRYHKAMIYVRPQTPMAASTQALINAFATGSSSFPLPPTDPAYDHAPLGHKTSMIRMRDDIPEEDMPPRKRFVLTAPPPRCDVAESSAAARAPRSQALLVRLETLETHVSRMKWHRQSAKDLVVTQMMRIHALEARAQTDTIEDASSSCGGLKWHVQPARVCSYIDFMKCQPLNFKGTEGIVGLSQWLKKMESVFHISGCSINNQVKFTTCTLLGDALTWWNGHIRTLCHDATYVMTWGTLKKKLTDKYCPKALMCTKFLANETEKVDKYISGLPGNIHGNVMSARPKTLDETIELANDLMDQKLCTYAESQNGVAQGRAYALGGRGANPNSNVITGTFLLNNCYAKILFDTGADRSFVSTTFSALIDITPTTLENHYDVELANRKIIGVNTIVRGFTLNFMNHPFNIDLMHVLLGSFNVIIGID
uniref:Reverse transcriptase domain-containing protein n=1 Tax=Tanacetum cinerariifolium TaxID=118510 RepID=A0A6L2MKL2_TANCI|nr:reverse transcriptase domain-containing protein [Tanacetum cinerariifolium]